VNILAYADDMVLLAPLWRGLQHLIDIFRCATLDIDITCNADKTVCMVFSPKNRGKIVAHSFPEFRINDICLKFVHNFRYLGHIISGVQQDASDIAREIRNLVLRTNILKRNFFKCSMAVKNSLFRSYCLCFYNIGLRRKFTSSSILKFKSCYHRRIKTFFGYNRFASVTQMLLDLSLPSFDTVIANNNHSFSKQCVTTNNALIQHFNLLGL